MDFSIFKQKDFIKDIKKQIKKTESMGDVLAKSFFNDDGECQIDIVLDKGNLYNEFSSKKQRRLNPDIFAYIDNNAYYVPLMYKICINIISDELSSKEKENIKSEIVNHYSLLIYDKKDDIRRNNIRTWIFIIFGVICLLAYFLIEGFQNGNALFAEVLSIAGSFGIWGALDSYIEKITEKKDLLNYSQLSLANIKFSSLKTDVLPKEEKSEKEG